MFEYYIVVCWYIGVFAMVCGISALIVKFLEYGYEKRETYNADKSVYR